MIRLEDFLEQHHDILTQNLPDGCRQSDDLPNEWAVKYPFHTLADGSVLSLVINLERRFEEKPLLDYRLRRDTATGNNVLNAILIMGEFEDTLNDLKHELHGRSLDHELTDDPGVHRMLYYVENLYWKLADDVSFNARYAPPKAG